MKKTLLSVTAALAVIGSACAAPSVEDRKTLCEKYPDKYVWVAKDEMCVPINPCLSDNPDIKYSYCATPDQLYYLPCEVSKRELIIERYVQNVLKSKVSEIRTIVVDGREATLGIKTADGAYFSAECNTVFDEGSSLGRDVGMCVMWAMNVYGYSRTDMDGQMVINRIRFDNPVCRHIADFASLLCGGNGQTIEPDSDSDVCSFHSAGFGYPESQ